MKLSLLLSSVLFCLPSLLYAQDTDYASRIKEVLTNDAAAGQFAGGSAGVSVGDQVIVATGGYRDIETNTAFERQTLSRTASIAKSMTAVAALQLFERGVLDLDEPISTYLPDYPRRHASRITTRMLLLHSSGIGAYKSGKEAQSTVEYASLTEAATVFQERDLIDEPGNAEHYTTYGYVVLGMVIEAVSGKTYEEYMTDHVWRPVGMDNTGVEHLSEEYPNKSSLYHRTKKGKVKLSKTNNLSNRVPGGGLYSTIDDLLKFGRAILGNTLINAETTTMMWEKPGLAYDGNPYGMGWFIYGENPRLGEVYGHGGEQTGCGSVLFVAPASDAVIVVMTNTAGAQGHAFGIAVKELFPIVNELKE